MFSRLFGRGPQQAIPPVPPPIPALEPWLASARARLPGDYQPVIGRASAILAPPSLLTGSLIRACDDLARGVPRVIDGLCSDLPDGRHALVLVDDIDVYYGYISTLYEGDGQFGLSAGLFTRSEPMHVVIHVVTEDSAAVTAAHELTHSCLRDLHLPLWVEEGITTNTQRHFFPWSGTPLGPQQVAELAAYWDTRGLDDFYSGESFQDGGEGTSESYDLAMFAVRALGMDWPRFVAFARDLGWRGPDGLDAALDKHYGVTRETLLSIVLQDPTPGRPDPSEAP